MNDCDGCIRLWASVMRKATADLVNNQGYTTGAKVWFFSDSNGVGTFLWCCDVLGLNPTAVREAISNGRLEEFGMHDMRKYNGLLQ